MNPLKGLKGYYLEYEQDYYNPKFSKRQVEIWAEKTLNDKEKMYIKEQKYIDPDFINLFNNDLSGTLPREWSSWTKIELLYVAWCKVVGCGMAIPWFFDAL